MSTDEDFVYFVTLSHKINTEFLEHVLEAALYGGIGYWAVADEILRADPRSGLISLHLSDTEDWSIEFGTVTHDTVMDGIRRILDGTVKISQDLRDHLAAGVSEGDAGEIDSDVADCIIQVGLFGELVYG